MVYSWRERPPAALDAQRVGEHLESLRLRNPGGLLLAEEVVRDARDKSSLLHPAFEWDDDAAAGAWRLGQARRLIRSVAVTFQAADEQRVEPVQAFVHLAELTAGGGEAAGYRPTVAVLAESEQRDKLLAQALRELEAWRRRYRDLQELAFVFEQLDQLAS